MIPLQSYYDNILKNTGKSPEDFKQLAIAAGFFENGVLKPGVKAGEILTWLKNNFGLGRGHGMAIYHSFK